MELVDSAKLENKANFMSRGFKKLKKHMTKCQFTISSDYIPQE